MHAQFTTDLIATKIIQSLALSHRLDEKQIFQFGKWQQKIAKNKATSFYARTVSIFRYCTLPITYRELNPKFSNPLNRTSQKYQSILMDESYRFKQRKFKAGAACCKL